MSVIEYVREFVRLSQYAREFVSTKAIMCKRFEDGLNEDIHLLVGILEIKEFVVLVERACKAEELGKEKRKADSEAREVQNRSSCKPFQSIAKKFRDDYSRSKANVGHASRDRMRSHLSFRAPATSVASVGNVQFDRPECKHCGKRHPNNCKIYDWSCFKFGSLDHFIRDCPESVEEEIVQNLRPSGNASHGRAPRNTGNVSGSQRGTKNTIV